MNLSKHLQKWCGPDRCGAGFQPAEGFSPTPAIRLTHACGIFVLSAVVRKLALCACSGLLAAASAYGQLIFERPQDGSPAPAILDVGQAAPGDVLDTRLRVRNVGTAAVPLSILRIQGTAFSLEGTPALNSTLAPGVNADFRVRFRPNAPGAYSATLQANTTMLLVRGASTPGLMLLREGASLTNDQTLEFGSVFVGQRVSIRLTLHNDSTQDLPVRQLSVTGAGYSLSPASLPSVVPAGEEAAFELLCEPPKAGPALGALQLDERSFRLAALGREPVAPDALLELDPRSARSGQQSSLRIRLASPATMAVTGSLRLVFVPAVAASAEAGDAGMQFLATSSRTVPVQVAPGDVAATVMGKPDVAFQTGTTAGAASFRLTLGEQEREVMVTLPPEAPKLDTVEMIRGGQGSVDVVLTGFDNHRSAGSVVFTFTDRTGQELPAVSAEAGAAFARHFAESPLGGLFRLTARFPVTGDASKLARVSVRLANVIGAGVGRSE